MHRFELCHSIAVAAPPATVLDYVSNPHTWREWMPATHDMTAPDRPLRPGDTFTEQWGTRKGEVTLEWRVTAHTDAEHWVAETSTSFTGLIVARYEVASLGSGGCTFTRRITNPARPKAPTAAMVSRMNAEAELCLSNIARLAAAPMADFPFGTQPPPPSAVLSADDIEHFCQQGFVVLRGMVPPADVAHLRSEVVAMLQNYRRNWTPTNTPVLPTPDSAMWQATGHGIDMRTGELVGCAFDAWMKPGPEDPTRAAAAADTLNPNRVQYINGIQLNAAVAEYNRSPRLLAALSQLLGEDINCTQCATVTKPGGINFDYHGWHQDIADYSGSGGIQVDGDEKTFRYFGTTNFGNVGTITYLGPGDSGEDTGSTSLIPGSHREPAASWVADGGSAAHHASTVGRHASPWRQDGPQIYLPTKQLRDGWPEPERSVAGLRALLPRVVTPTFSEGDVLIFDSWILHRANSNIEVLSKLGVVQVYTRPDCLRRDTGEMAGGQGWPVLRNGRAVATDASTEVETARL